jgi:CRP-like cAMP-binding protein
MHFEKGDVLLEKGSSAKEVFLNLGGYIRNTDTNRVYGKGALIGQDDILLERVRLSSIVADTECFTMRLDGEYFNRILLEYPEIRYKLTEDCKFR